MNTPLTTLRGVTTAAALGHGRVATGRRAQGQRPGTTDRAVLDAATSLAAERGVDAVTASAVGAAAGYSSTIVTGRFGDRAMLLDVLTKDLQDRFQPPASDLPGLARLLEVVDAYLRERTPHSQAFVNLWAEAVAGEPDLQPAFAARDTRFRATLVEYLRDGIADGTIRHDVEPEALAASLVGQLRAAKLRPDEAARGELVTLLERGLRTG
jgi:AcrR family transcriptional regulator